MSTAPLKILGALLFPALLNAQTYAQGKSEISVTTFGSSLFIDSNKKFFDGISFSTVYQRGIDDYIGFFIGFSTLSAIKAKDDVNLGLDRFSISLLSLNSGVELLLVKKNNYLFGLGIGGELRNRKEVTHDVAFQLANGDNFTRDVYENSNEIGIILNLNQSIKLSDDLFFNIINQFKIFNDEHSVFNVGIGLSKTF